jgi:hypothetical protein
MEYKDVFKPPAARKDAFDFKRRDTLQQEGR